MKKITSILVILSLLSCKTRKIECDAYSKESVKKTTTTKV